MTRDAGNFYFLCFYFVCQQNVCYFIANRINNPWQKVCGNAGIIIMLFCAIFEVFSAMYLIFSRYRYWFKKSFLVSVSFRWIIYFMINLTISQNHMGSVPLSRRPLHVQVKGSWGFTIAVCSPFIPLHTQTTLYQNNINTSCIEI